MARHVRYSNAPTAPALGLLQATIYYSQQLGLNKKVDLRGLFRGAGFAAARDLISQGIPFMWAGDLRRAAFDPLISPEARAASEPARLAHHWGPILAASIASTCACVERRHAGCLGGRKP